MVRIKKGLAEYGIFACEQAGYAGTTKITDTIGWGQGAIDSWLGGSGIWNNPPVGDKHVLCYTACSAHRP